MNFKEHLLQAKAGDYISINHIIELYQPLLMKESIIDGIFDEDLHQEMMITLLRCIQKFVIPQ